MQGYKLLDYFDTICTGLNYADTIANITQDTKVYLEADVNNKYDRNAIAIRLVDTKQKMGYVNGQDAANLYPLFKHPEIRMHVMIKDKHPEGKKYCPIIICVFYLESSTNAEELALRILFQAKQEAEKRKPWNLAKAAALSTLFKSSASTTVDIIRTDVDE